MARPTRAPHRPAPVTMQEARAAAALLFAWATLAAVLVLLFAVGAAAEEVRSAKAVRDFKRATGYPNGWAGHVVDHIVPLCAGGIDAPANMQWQTREDSYRKDVLEREICRGVKARGAVARTGYVFTLERAPAPLQLPVVDAGAPIPTFVPK